jgi:hypothetical protein
LSGPPDPNDKVPFVYTAQFGLDEFNCENGGQGGVVLGSGPLTVESRLQVVPAMLGEQLAGGPPSVTPPGATAQNWPPVHVRHAAPPMPHVVAVTPGAGVGMQAPPVSQHPVQFAGPHEEPPHCCGVPAPPQVADGPQFWHEAPL